MAQDLIINGLTYSYPSDGEQPGWGAAAATWAAAVTSGMLQKAGGSFTLTSEVDFGATYGLKSVYFKSRTADPASAGQIRLAKSDVISFRDEADSADLDLGRDSGDDLTWDSVKLATQTWVTTQIETADQFTELTDTPSSYSSQANKVVAVNSGETAAEFIFLANANIAAAAAIAYSKLAALTASRVPVTDGSGFLTASSVTATVLGYLDATSSIQTQLNAKFASADVIDEDNMASDSAAKVPTQQSVKAYVDTHTADTTAHGATGAVVGTTNTQTLTNKTLTSPVLDTGVSGTAFLDEDNMASDSATKVASQQSIKAYVDNEVAGAGGGGSGETNYITNPDGAASLDQGQTNDVGDWIDSNASNFTATATSTSSEIPRDYLKSTAIKLKPVTTTAGDYIRHRFTMGESDKNKKLKIQWTQLIGSTYANDDFKVELYVNDAVDYTGTYTEVPLSSDVSNESYIKAFNGNFLTSFSSDDNDYYELRIEKVSTTAVVTTDWITLNDVIVGPGIVAVTPDPRWPTYQGDTTGTDVDITLAAGGGTLSSVERASFVPYQLTDGTWRMVFNVAVTVSSTSRTSVSLGLSGVAFNDDYVVQDIGANFNGTVAVLRGYAYSPTDRLTVTHASNTATQYFFSGDVELDSKPTWATKMAPDIYLGTVPSIVGPWTSYTPTFDISPGTYVAEWRRVGEEMEIRYTNAATDPAFINGRSMSMPSGYTMSNEDGIAVGVGIKDNASFAVHSTATNQFTLRMNGSTPTKTSLLVSVKIDAWAGGSQDTATIGISEATSTQLGLVRKNKWARHDLSSNLTTSTTATSLTFNNLVVGQHYKVSGQATFTVNTSSSDPIASLAVTHDSTVIQDTRLTNRQTSATNYDESTSAFSVTFKATASTLTFVGGSCSAYSYVVSGTGKTFAILEEVHNIEDETTDFD